MSKISEKRSARRMMLKFSPLPSSTPPLLYPPLHSLCFHYVEGEHQQVPLDLLHTTRQHTHQPTINNINNNTTIFISIDTAIILIDVVIIIIIIIIIIITTIMAIS